MSTAVDTTTRTLTITLPESIAQWVEDSARKEHTDVDAILQWALRVYRHQSELHDEELDAPIDPDNPHSMSLAQVNDSIKQMRRETREHQSV